MFIYKYYEPESVDFILTNEGVSLRFSQPEILNDPFELLPTLKTFIEKNTNSFNNEWTELEKDVSTDAYYNKSKLLLSNLLNNLGVLSLSKNESSRPMWSYYSKDHSGYLIEFKSKKQLLNNGKNLYEVGCIKFFDTIYSEERVDDPMDDPSEYFYIKDSEWRHERELRATDGIKLEECEKQDSNGYPIYTKNLDAGHVESIVLGVRSSPILERKAKLWIKKYAPNVNIKKARLCDSKFKLIYDEI